MAEAAKENQGHKRALVVSISQYDNLAALDFCERDGNTICEILTQLGYDIPIKYRLIGGRIEYDKLRDSILDFFMIRPLILKIQSSSIFLVMVY